MGYRNPPAAAPGAYQTFQVSSPSDRLLQVACQTAGCQAWRDGWTSTFDESTDLGRTQADYVRRHSGRTFKEQRTGTGLTVFVFESGQRCFREHHTRPEFYAVRGGDWRADLGLIRRHARPADWVEDFGEHQQRVADQIEKG